jgi:hypothetical protein
VPSLTPHPVIDRRETFGRSFDFSELPNLQEVGLGVGWKGGDLFWLPAALSTLKRATSSRLSVLQVHFVVMSTATRSVETLIEDMSNDLRRAAEEFARIEREFEGGVDLTVSRDPKFKAMFDTLNVRFRSRGVDGTS